VAEVCIVHAGGWRDALALIGTALRRRHRADPRVRYLPVRHQATIATATPLPVQADGEIVAHTPVTVRVVPAAVQVVVPESPAQVVRENRTGETTAAAGTPIAPGTSPPPPQVRARAAGHALRRIATLGAIDAALFLRLNALQAGARADRALRGACRLLDHGELWIALAALASLIDPAHHRRLAFEVLPPLWLTMVAVNFGIKRIFRRVRPFSTYVDARVIGRRPADWSFPSGHAAAAFAGALLLSAAFPALAPVFFAYAIVVGFARVYLGVHYPSDVLIGAGAGIVLAAVLGTVIRAVLPVA
jgi:undecaprenyl-diphosphatase